MLREVRLHKIEESLQGQPFLEIKAIARSLRVSEATVRRDLEMLHRAGRIKRTRGGAMNAAVVPRHNQAAQAGKSGSRKLPPVVHDEAPLDRVTSFTQRRAIAAAAKQRIGNAASGLIQDGQSVLIAGGTTCYAAAQFLKNRRISVVTNSLPSAALLGETLGVDVLVTGGMVYPKHDILIGPQLKQTLDSVQSADWLLIGAGGADAAGFYDSNHWEVEAQRELMARAGKVALLLDSAKFMRRDIILVADWQHVDFLVTDAAPKAPLARALKAANVQVLVEK